MKAAAEHQTDGNYGGEMFSFLLLLPEDPTCRLNPLSGNRKYPGCSQAAFFSNNKVLKDWGSKKTGSCLEVFCSIFQTPALTLLSLDQSSPISLPVTHRVILQGFTQEVAMHLPQFCMCGF